MVGETWETEGRKSSLFPVKSPSGGTPTSSQPARIHSTVSHAAHTRDQDRRRGEGVHFTSLLEGRKVHGLSVGSILEVILF